MPALKKSPVNELPATFGAALRAARVAAGLTQQALAQRAHVGRQKLIEVEQGKPGVAAATYVAVAQALGLEFAVQPARVRLDAYPQLKRLAWNRHDDLIEEKEALALYERKWSLVDGQRMTPRERAFLDRLVEIHGGGILHV